MERVYFFKESAMNAIKIGRSQNVRGRFDQIRNGMPQDLEFLGYMDGSAAKEKEIHAKFSHLKLKGEWFQFDQSIIDFVQSNTNQVLPPQTPIQYKPRFPYSGKTGPIRLIVPPLNLSPKYVLTKIED